MNVLSCQNLACYNTQANKQHLARGTINCVTVYLLGSVAQHQVPQSCCFCSSNPCPHPRAFQLPWHSDSHIERLALTSRAFQLGLAWNRSLESSNRSKCQKASDHYHDYFKWPEYDCESFLLVTHIQGCLIGVLLWECVASSFGGVHRRTDSNKYCKRGKLDVIQVN